MKISEVSPELAPRHLLLLADPSEARIERYLASSRLFIGEEEGVTIGVAAIRIDDDFAELLNLAVAEAWQRRGKGSVLLGYIIKNLTAQASLA